MVISVHQLLALLGIAIAANLDNLGVGAAYGLADCRIPAWSNGIISLIAIALTALAIVSGSLLKTVLPPWIANDIGASLILVLGLYFFWQPEIMHWRSLRYSRSHTSTAPPLAQANQAPRWDRLMTDISGAPSNSRHHHTVVGWRETLLLGTSLALNAMAGGFGAGLAGYSWVPTTLAIGMCSFLAIAIGQQIAGTYLSKWFGRFAPRISGILLILISIYEFLT